MSGATARTSGTLGWTGLALACIVLGWLGPLPGLSPDEQRALSITLFAMILWTAQPVPIEVSSFAVLLLLASSGLLTFTDTFAPFAGPTI